MIGQENKAEHWRGESHVIRGIQDLTVFWACSESLQEPNLEMEWEKLTVESNTAKDI